MKKTGQDVPGTFPGESDDVPLGIGLQRRAREQGPAARWRHGHRRMLALMAAGAMAAAGGTAALLAASVSQAPSALTTVTSAVAKTSADSYSFRVNSTVRFAGREVNSSAVTGVFDPGHKVGWEQLAILPARSKSAQIRFIGEYVYTWVSPGSGFRTIGKPWDKAPAPPSGADVLGVDGPYGFSTEQPVSPAELLAVLRYAAAVRGEAPASGPGWTGTKYGFTARLSALKSVSGTVYVDQQGRVRRLVTITTLRSRAPGSRAAITTDRDLTFGDFGAPVSVTAPAASQVEYTSTPYWGFFF